MTTRRRDESFDPLVPVNATALRAAVAKRGLSLRSIAGEADVANEQLSRLRSGRLARCRQSALVRIAAALGVAASSLVGGPDSRLSEQVVPPRLSVRDHLVALDKLLREVAESGTIERLPISLLIQTEAWHHVLMEPLPEKPDPARAGSYTPAPSDSERLAFAKGVSVFLHGVLGPVQRGERTPAAHSTALVEVLHREWSLLAAVGRFRQTADRRRRARGIPTAERTLEQSEVELALELKRELSSIEFHRRALSVARDALGAALNEEVSEAMDGPPELAAEWQAADEALREWARTLPSLSGPQLDALMRKLLPKPIILGRSRKPAD